MARLNWRAVGERFFEGGVDQGVLYVDDNPGVAWNGITAVDEQPEGGQAKPYYMDGIKFLNLSDPEEFVATLNAYYSPPEFDVCDGSWELRPGILATQQPRKHFGLCYRTKIGNDLEGLDHGYKIHIVYNAQAEPTQRSNNTLTNDPDLDPLSWRLTTAPIHLSGAVWSAHIIINSLTTHPGVLAQLEDILYGTPTTPPRLPLPEEIVGLVGVILGIDGGHPDLPGTEFLDGGYIPAAQTEYIDGGTF